MSGAAFALVLLVVLGVSGFGIALCLPRAGHPSGGLLFDSIAIGLIVQEILGFLALRTNHYSLATLLASTLVILGVSLLFAYRRGTARTPLSVLNPLGSWHLRAPVDRLVTVAFPVVVVVALFLRQGPSYFIFETGDMGEYVNDANILINRHFLNASFPHGFTLFLSGTHLVLGREHTVAGLPALGVLLLIAVFAYTRAIRLHPLAALGIAVLIAAHPVTVWFSLFPVSESLYAALLIISLYFVVQARSNTSNAHAVLGGLSVGVMLLVRGNAMLLAPIIVVAMLASAMIDDERTVRVHRLFTVVGLLALSVAYAYNVRYLPAYFVENQLNQILPHRVYRLANTLHLFDVSIELVLAIAVAIAAVLAATALVTTRLRTKVIDRPTTFWRVAYAGSVVVTGALLLVIHHAGLKDALARWGAVLVLLTIVGVLGVVVRPGRYLDGVSAFLLLLVICTYSVLFAARVPRSLSHAYYLYYDRYLFSEVLPAALVFAAIALHVIVDAYGSVVGRQVVRSRAAVARVAIVGLCIVAAIDFVPEVRETHRITRFPLFGASYATLARLDALTRTKGPGNIVYSAPKTIPAGWFFPNTFRAFALPIVQSFRGAVVGLPVDAFGRDLQFDPAAARAELQKVKPDKPPTGYLVSLRAPGAAPYASDAHTEFVASVRYVCPTLRRDVIRGPTRWVLVPFVFDVYFVH